MTVLFDHEDVRMLASGLDPQPTDVKEHTDYKKMNVHKGRVPGQLRIRARYLKYATPWFDFLLLSPPGLEDILYPLDRRSGTASPGGLA